MMYQLTQYGVLRSDGAHVPNDTRNADWREYLAWVEDGNTPDPMAAAPPVPRIVSPREFRMRFTIAERGAITVAASHALIAGDATLQVYLDDLSSATEIDLDHPEITEGLDALVAVGLLTVERRDEMLD